MIVANGRHTLHVCIWANPWLDLNLHQAKLWTGRGWRRFKMHVNWQTETRRRFHPGFCNVNGRSLLLFLLPPQAPEAFEAVCSWEREGLFDAERLRGHPVEPRTPLFPQCLQLEPTSGDGTSGWTRCGLFDKIN